MSFPFTGARRLSKLRQQTSAVLVVFTTFSLLLTSMAQADLTTAPYHFTDQATPSSGTIEWDEFSGGSIVGQTFGDFAPDVAEVGGSGSLSLFFTPQPFDGPPFPLLTSTQNIYTGGTLADFDIDVTGLSTLNANSTVVLQLSLIGGLDESSILLDGQAPVSLLDRGVAADVMHNTDDGGGAAFDTRFYWAEWQVASASAYQLEFSTNASHASFAQARVDYYNTATTFDALAPASVPEPGATLMLAALVGGVWLRRRR